MERLVCSGDVLSIDEMLVALANKERSERMRGEEGKNELVSVCVAALCL